MAMHGVTIANEMLESRKKQTWRRDQRERDHKYPVSPDYVARYLFWIGRLFSRLCDIAKTKGRKDWFRDADIVWRRLAVHDVELSVNLAGYSNVIVYLGGMGDSDRAEKDLHLLETWMRAYLERVADLKWISIVVEWEP